MAKSFVPTRRYGQSGKSAYNPAERADVYQLVNQAKSDSSLAFDFANDILWGGQMAYYRVGHMNLGRPHRGSSGGPTLVTDPQKAKLSQDENISLNKYASWVPQAFTAAMKGDDGNWYSASSLYKTSYSDQQVNGKSGSVASTAWTYLPRDRITDQNLISQLNGGHYAFKAAAADGTEVYMGWADDFTPSKGKGGSRAGDAEAGDKKTARSATREREMVGPGQADPGNVIGGLSSTLLGGSGNLGSSASGALMRTLLGGSGS